jgi:hypothetical protein
MFMYRVHATSSFSSSSLLSFSIAQTQGQIPVILVFQRGYDCGRDRRPTWHIFLSQPLLMSALLGTRASSGNGRFWLLGRAISIL